MTSETCVSRVLSWHHWAKFCVSHGGFGAMAPAPLVETGGISQGTYQYKGDVIAWRIGGV